VEEQQISLVLRVCRADFTSRNGFQWPSEVGAAIEAPDWSPRQECGSGLHGWLYGQGDISCVDYWVEENAQWLVLEVESASIVMLGGKCKFPKATVRFAGHKSEAAAFLLAHAPQAKNVAVIGATIAVGDGEVAAVGALGTATAGYRGTATAGDRGTATAGDRGTATAGYRGTATAGDRGTATAGYSGTATAGDSGTATAGDSGTATAGYSGTATAGDRGTATAGDSGTISIKWWGGERYRVKIGYIGEDGLKPNVPYRLNDQHEFEEVK